jgi:exonuclease V gamma subunit
VRFFRNPAQAFMRDGLGADVSVSGSAAPEDSEMFERTLDWSWKEELLQLCLETDEPERDALKQSSLQRLKANGAIPLTQQEDKWEDWAEILLLVHETESLTRGGTEPIPAEEIVLEYSAADAGEAVDVLDSAPGGSFRTTLVLPETAVCQPDVPDGPCLQVIPCFVGDQVSGAQLIGPLMSHLRTNLSRATRTRIVYISKNNAVYQDADAMERADAEAAVKRLLYLSRAGMCAPLPFFPKTSYQLFRTRDDGSAESVWNGNPNSEGEKKKFRAFFGDDMPDFEQVEAIAEAVFGTATFHEVKGGPA